MNIGIDIRSLMNPVRTGVGEYTYELLNALFKIDQENEYVLFANGPTKNMEQVTRNKENVRCVFTKYPNKVFNSSIQILQWPKLDKMCDVDVWFSPNIGFTSLSKKTKHILTIHDLSFEHFADCYSWKRRLWHKVLNPKKQCQRADLILTPSENTRRDVVDTYGIQSEKVTCIYPGLAYNGQSATSDEQVRKKYLLPKKFILFLGTIEPRKNILGALEAFAQAKELHAENYKLIIAGPKGWKYEPILQAIDQERHARYIGFVAPEDKAALMSMADLFVYPSLYEGFGFPVLEAMQVGTPVVTSNRSSLPEITAGAAHLVDPLNTSDISRGMERVLTDLELQTTLIERGKQRIEGFHWERAARDYLSILHHRV